MQLRRPHTNKKARRIVCDSPSSAIALMWPRRYATGGRSRGTIRLIRNSTMNTKNNTCAIDVAVPATPPKPSAAEISAITRNVSAQPSMIHQTFLKTGNGQQANGRLVRRARLADSASQLCFVHDVKLVATCVPKRAKNLLQVDA